MNKLIGTQFKVVQGYKGTAEQYLAMEKGETEGMGNAIWSQPVKIAQPGTLSTLFLFLNDVP